MNRRMRGLIVFVGIPLLAGAVWWVLSPTSTGQAFSNSAANGDLMAAPVTSNSHTKSSQTAATKSTNELSVTKGNLMVDIEGAVQKPGLHSLSGAARVQDAIDAAGGVTNEGVTTGLNLAAKVSDGAQIVVPGKTAEPAGSNAGSGVAVEAAGKVVLNRASSSELGMVPGISKTRSDAIVKYRMEHGPFLRVEDLLQVKGVTQKVFDQISPKLTLN